MAKQPFTPSGVQAKVAELYALPPGDLLTHANQVGSDFKGWMTANFILSTDQQDYMDTINEDWIDLTSVVLKMAIKKKRPIILEPIVGGGSWASKLVGFTNDMDSTNKDGVFEITGTLTFYITYET